MKRKLFSYFRRWQELNHQGLTEDDFGGLRKFERAKAMGFLTAIVPSIPLMISDLSGLERGWLWHIWGAFAVAWLLGILALIFWNSGQSLARYIRDWRDGRR